MLLKPHLSVDSRRSESRSGWSLVEMVVAVGAGMILLMAFISAFVTLSNTMVAIGNYNDLDSSSRHTLDLMNEDLRNTASVTNATSTLVKVYNPLSGDSIMYWWDSGTTCFKRQLRNASGTSTSVLLTNCDFLNFSYYTRVPTNNFGFITNNTGDPSQSKLISVSWRCSRTVLGIKLNTESVQTARICIRN